MLSPTGKMRSQNIRCKKNVAASGTSNKSFNRKMGEVNKEPHKASSTGRVYCKTKDNFENGTGWVYE